MQEQRDQVISYLQLIEEQQGKEVDFEFIIIQDFTKILLDHFEKNRKENYIEKLRISSCNITDDFLAISQKYDWFKCLSELDLSYSSNLTCNLLNSFFYNNNLNQLKKLNLTQCNINDSTLTILSSSTQIQNLELLDLSFCNEVSDDGVNEFVNSSNSSNIKYLNLKGIFITDCFLNQLDSSQYMKSIKKLSLYRCKRYTYIGLTQVINSDKCKYLEYLDLSCSGIDSDGVYALAKTKNLINLKHLKIYDCNKPSKESFAALLDSQQIIEHLNGLDLSCVNLSDEGLINLNKQQPSQLRELNIPQCPYITTETLKIIFSNGNAFKGLRCLDISFLKISLETMIIILNGIQEKQLQLCEIHIFSCPYIKQGMNQLVKRAEELNIVILF